MSYWLHPEAEIKFTEAAVYYAEHASNFIASAFVTGFERVVALLALNQNLGTPAIEGLRVYPFHRFPLFIGVPRKRFWATDAVSHHNREPRYWQCRLQSLSEATCVTTPNLTVEEMLRDKDARRPSPPRLESIGTSP